MSTFCEFDDVTGRAVPTKHGKDVKGLTRILGKYVKGLRRILVIIRPNMKEYAQNGKHIVNQSKDLKFCAIPSSLLTQLPLLTFNQQLLLS